MTRLVALSLASAALLATAHRPWSGTGYLAFIALIPLLAALNGEKRLARGALAGWLASLGVGLVAFEGVAPAEFWAYPLLVVVAGIPWAIAGLLFVLVMRHINHAAAIWSFLPIMLVAEFVPAQRWLLGDFANAISALGYTQFDTPLLTAAGWSGATGVSLLLVAFNVALYVARRGGFVPAGVVLTVVLAAVLVPIPGGSDLKTDAEPTRITVVQGAVSSIDTLLARFDRQAAERMLEPYANLTAQAGERGTDLVVWGETVLPHAVRPGHVPDYVARALESAPVALVGGVSYTGGESYNSIFHWADGKLTEIYRKRALVPINESHYTPGQAMPSLESGGLRLGLGVCLDSIFGSFARESVRSGAEALVYVTEDSLAVRPVTPELHLRVTAFRAAETGRYVVFANQSGPSAIIDNRGRIIERIGHGQTAAILTDLPAYQGVTPFVLAGDWVGLFSTAILLAGLPLMLTRRQPQAMQIPDSSIQS